MLRGSQRLSFELVPKAVVEEGHTVGKIGLGASLSGAGGFPESMQMVERYGPLSALGPAVRETWGKSALTVRFLWRDGDGRRLHQEHLRADQHRAVRRADGDRGLHLLSRVPGPGFDLARRAEPAAGACTGRRPGRVSAPRDGERRPISMKAQVLGQKVGIAMLVALMGFAFYNDITGLFG